MLDTVTIEPQQPAKQAVIWLHGLGADGHDFAPIVSQLQLPATLAVRFIFPHAPMRPVGLFSGMPARAWFDLSHSEQEGFNYNLGELIDMAQQVAGLIEQQLAQGIKPQHIVLAGFSQGGAMALYTALTMSSPIGGVMGLSTFLPVVKELTAQVSQRFPVLIAHGTADEIVAYEHGLSLAEGFKQAGFVVSWHSYPMGHTVCQAEITDLSNWLASVLTT